MHSSERPGRPERQERIVVVEDEPITRAQLVSLLEAEQFDVQAEDTGHGLLDTVCQHDADVVLLDIRLPGEDGLSLARQLRAKSDVGIILVTAKSDQVDRIVGLESGADDYVTKPFDPRELTSRVRNLLRRVRHQRRNAGPGQLRQFDRWRVDLNKRQLTDETGTEQPLSAGEYQLLLAFLEAPDEVLSRDHLMAKIRNREWFPDDRYIDVLVGQLRKKLGERAGNARVIRTIHGAGYLFAAEIH